MSDTLPFEIIPVTPLQQNCTLLLCPASDNAALVDPGGDSIDLVAAGANATACASKKSSSPTATSITAAAPWRCASATACRSKARTRPTRSGSTACR